MDYKEHYRLDAEVFDYFAPHHYTAIETRRNQATFYFAGISAGQRILDIGSGRGWFSLYAASQGARVTALDLSERNLQQIKALDGRIETMLDDAAEPTKPQDKYDLIVALEVLEHLVDPAKAIANWKKLLKPGGRLLITVPYKEVIRYSLCIHCNQKTPFNAHLHSFDRPAMQSLLSGAGMKVISMKPFCHKLPVHFRLDRLTLRLPYAFWHALDRICGLFSDQYNYLAVICGNK